MAKFCFEIDLLNIIFFFQIRGSEVLIPQIFEKKGGYLNMNLPPKASFAYISNIFQNISIYISFIVAIT